MSSAEDNIALEAAANDSVGGLATRDTHLLGCDSEQSPINELKPVDNLDGSIPTNKTVFSRDDAVKESPKEQNQGNAASEPTIDSSQTEDNSMEESFIKTMLNFCSGDINTTIELQSQLVSLIPDQRSDKPSQLNNLAISYQTRFGRLGDVSDLEKAIDSLNNAITLLPPGHLGQPVCLNNLGSAYRSRYERLGELEDLEKAVTHQNQSILIAPDTSADKPAWLNNLGNTYQRRFERLDDMEDLQKAITCKTQAVELTPDGHNNKPAFLSNLGSCFKSRFERRGELLDIHQAIEYQTQSVALTSDDNEDKSIWLNNLGISYQRRFERLGQVEDIENAIECQLKALMLTPEGHTDRPLWMSNLGILYQHRYKVLGDDEDITQSIDYQSKALLLCPEDHYKRSSIHLNLGNSLCRRFERYGRVGDLDKAIEHVSLAISSLPRGHPDGPLWLSNLGSFYTVRYDIFKEVTDMDKANNCLVKAFVLIPDDHTKKPEILVHLAISHRIREPTLIDVAISSITRAISLTPDDHESKPIYIQELGYSHYIRFKHLQEAKDLDEAINHQTMAISLAPHNLPHRVRWLSALGQAHHDRFDCNGNLEDLNTAITHYSTAISETPNDHALSPEISSRLAHAHEARFIRCSTREDLDATISWYQRAAHPTPGLTGTAFSAARKWAQLSSQHKLPCVHTAYQRVMELVPQLLWLGSTVEQRYSELKAMGGIVLEAVSHAISSQLYDLALEWLEQGRSIVWSQILQLRTPFDALSAVDKYLANELHAIGRNLERAGSRSTDTQSLIGETFDLKREAQRHRELASEWDRLLTKVRTIPGFEEFLRPKRKRDLMSASKNGPVVIINVGETQGDALILVSSKSEIAHIPLQGISRPKARLLRSQFYPLLRDHGLISRGTRGIKVLGYNPRLMFAKVLGTLWTDIVEPILSFLGIRDALPIEELPHVTWCTTGELAGLPLHAAGLYDSPYPGAFDLVISSYTPTISALMPPSPGAPSEFSGVLAVGQENTPGFSRIANTVAELRFIEERSGATSSPCITLEGDKATIDSVLTGMDQCSWVHFACHASQKADDPTTSSFHLHDGGLKLSTITQKSFKNKGLAFLSACQTATGAEDLPDEAVHLAAGLLMAGYPSVIATLWSVHDVDAPEVSREVYADMITDQGPNPTNSARALHAAVQKLRTKVGYKLFERWACFIHLGV